MLVIKAIQRKFGLQGKIFKDNRYKHVAIVVKINDCNNCLLGCNKIIKIILPKTIVKEKVAVAV